MMFKKSRELIRIRSHGENIFIETPGYLYHYEPFDQYLFVHHKVVFDESKEKYYMLPATWKVTEPRTGLVVDNQHNSGTRKASIAAAHDRLSKIPIEDFHEAVLLGLASAPERKPQFIFFSQHYAAVEVRGGQGATDS